MTDTQKYTVNTQYGALVAVFLSETKLRVYTEFDTHDYGPNGRVDRKGGRLVLRGVEYTADTTLHPKGACKPRPAPSNFGDPDHGHWCSDDHDYGWAIGSIVDPQYAHGRRSKPGEVEPSSTYASIQRADGQTATWKNRGILSEAIVRAANTLVRTARNGPEEARIANLHKEYAALQIHAAKLREEMRLAEIRITTINAKLIAAMSTAA